MRLELKVELADSSGSDGDIAHAPAVKRRLRTESEDGESFYRGTDHNRVDESHMRLSELRGARRTARD